MTGRSTVMALALAIAPAVGATSVQPCHTLRHHLRAIHRGPDHAQRRKIIRRWLTSQITWARDRFDPKTMLAGSRRRQGHVGLGLSQAVATVLLQSTDPADVETGRRVLHAAIDRLQVTDPEHKHVGGYGSIRTPGEVNVCGIGHAFGMCHYLWMYLKLRDRMGPELGAKLRRSLAMGTEWLMRYDNNLWYSNSEMQNMASLLVAADLLDHQPGQAKGRKLFDRWCDWQLRIGLVNEYNCPGYGQPQLSAIALIAAGAKDPGVALRAMLLFERLLLQHSSFFHAPSQRAAGPNKRRYGGILYQAAYVNCVLAREVPGFELTEDRSIVARTTIEDYHVPDYFHTILFHKDSPYTIRARTELKDDHAGDAVCTMTPDYAMGAAGRGRTLQWGNIGNHLSVLYPRARGPEGQMGWGIAGMRFHSAGGPQSGDDLWLDKGNTQCLQHGTTAIGLSRACYFDSLVTRRAYYSYRGKARDTTVAVYPGVKLLAMDVGFFSDGADPHKTTRVWVDGQPVATFPYESDRAAPVVVRDTNVLVGIRPIDVPDLGRDRRLVVGWRQYHKRPTLVVRYPLYRGPARDFHFATISKLAGALAIECACARHQGAVEAFIQRVGASRASMAGPRGERPTYTYASADTEIAATFDFQQNKWVNRTVNGQPFRAPVWASNDAGHSDTGLLRVRDAVLRTKPGVPVWMIAVNEPRRVVVYNATDTPTPVDLCARGVHVQIDKLGLGKIVCRIDDKGNTRVEIVSLSPAHGAVRADDARATVTCNGRPVDLQAGTDRF